MIHVDAARRSLENVPTVLHFFWGTNVHQVTIAMPLPIPGSRWNCRNTFCRQTNCRTPRWRWHGWNRNESKPVIEPKLAKMRQQAAAWKTRALQNVFSHPKMCSPMPFQSYKMFSILNPLDKCGKYEAYKMQFHHQNPSSDCPKEAPTKCISFIIRAL